MEITQDIIHRLTEAGLKITPQRVSVLECLIKSNQHPTAEELYANVSKTIPGLSLTTIYNTLDTFVEKGLIKKVKTDVGVMRYDSILEHHHHMYSLNSGRVEDYFDPELDKILSDYFMRKQINGFKINDIRLQLMGEFDEKQKQ